jgi:uncharacterized membrane protein
VTDNQRLWEIDVLRGIAIVMMIAYHIYFDIYFLKILDISFFSAWYIGSLFLFIVGISLTLSYSRVHEKLSSRHLFVKYAKRGMMIFCFGLIITGVTWVIIPEWFIVFGILHCIGLSIIVGFFFLRWEEVNIVLGGVLTFIGLWLYSGIRWDFPWLLWLGFVPQRFQTLDYFPLLPWFGIVLIGIGIGNMLYSQGKRQFFLPDWEHVTFFKFLGFLGRHSLLIYLVHQPIILGILMSIIWV